MSEGYPQRDGFLQRALGVARGMPGVTGAEPLTSEFGMNVQIGERTSTVFLENLYRELERMPPDEIEEGVRQFLGHLFQEPAGSGARSRGALRLVLRPLSMSSSLQHAREHGGQGGPAETWLAEPFAPHLAAVLVEDRPTAIAYANRATLAELGLTTRDALAVARANLAALASEGLEEFQLPCGARAFRVEQIDGYEPSRLLIHGWLAAFEGRVAGRPVAIVPHTGLLVVTGDADPAAIGELLGIALQAVQRTNRWISPAPYTIDRQGAVVPYQLAPEQPNAAMVGACHVYLANFDYESQREGLQGVPSFRERGVELARFQVLVRPDDGRSYGFTEWSGGRPQLLPRADLLLVQVAGRPCFVPFTQAEALAGAAFAREPGLEPERVLARGTPDAGLLDRLAAVAIDLRGMPPAPQPAPRSPLGRVLWRIQNWMRGGREGGRPQPG